MADDGMLQTPPTDAISSGTGTGSGLGKLSFLSAAWVNQRVANVTERVEAYLDRIIDRGLLADGYMPFETPLTDEMLARMSPDQFRALFDATPSLEGKAQLLDRVKTLHLPPKLLLPYPPGEYPPAQPSAGALAHEPNSPVSSS